MKTSRHAWCVSGLAVALACVLASDARGAVIDYWRFEEASGQALDSAGPNPGTLQGPAIRSPNVFGTPVPSTGAPNTQSMLFPDSPGGAVDMGFSPDRGLGDFTIEAWINRSGDNPDGYAVIAGKFPSGDYGDTGWALYARVIPEGTTHYEVALLSRLNGGTFNVAGSGTFLLDLGQWYHVAGVRNGSEFRLYVDGIQRGSLTVPASVDYSAPLQTFSIGGSRGGGVGTWGGNFFGLIDEVRLSDTALTPDKFLNGPLAPNVAGDFDGDGDVDGADFVAWQTNFPKASGATLAQGDADGDGDVDGADFVVWQTNFPFTPGPGVAPVPEPGAVGMALIVLFGFWIARWRYRGDHSLVH